MTYYVVIEGPDGSGKTAVSRKLKQAMEDAGVFTHLFREPGGCSFSEAVRELLLTDPRAKAALPYSQALLLAASSWANARLYNRAHSLMIGDRWAPISSRVYQSLMAQTDPEELAAVNSFWYAHTQNLKTNAEPGKPKRPDLIIYLKTSSQTAWDRCHARGDGPDNMDQRVREYSDARVAAYDKFLDTGSMYGIPRVVVPTDSRSVDEVAGAVINAVINQWDDATRQDLNFSRTLDL